MKIVEELREISVINKNQKGDWVIPLIKGELIVRSLPPTKPFLKLPLFGSFRGNSLCTNFTFKEGKGNKVLFLFEAATDIDNIRIIPKGFIFWEEIERMPRLEGDRKLWVVIHPIRKSVLIDLELEQCVYEVRKGLIVRHKPNDLIDQ